MAHPTAVGVRHLDELVWILPNGRVADLIRDEDLLKSAKQIYDEHLSKIRNDEYAVTLWKAQWYENGMKKRSVKTQSQCTYKWKWSKPEFRN